MPGLNQKNRHFLHLRWADVESQCRLICSNGLIASKVSLIGTLTRGGLVPATIIAHRLGVSSVVARTDAQELGVAMARELAPSGLALVVDDVSERGGTLALVDASYEQAMEWKRKVGEEYRPLQFAVLLANPTGFRASGHASLLRRTAVGAEIDNSRQWAVFPWESESSTW